MIRQIRNAPQTVQNVVTYDAVIDVRERGPQAQAGHDGQRHHRHRQTTNVLAVPNAALRFRPPARGRGPGAGGKPARGRP